MHHEVHETKTTNHCVIPKPKLDVIGDNRWESMHLRYVAEAKASEAEVLFVGDSIIQQLQLTSLWSEKINSLHCLNFGIGGDRVENVLWRLLNGELDFSVPVKAVVLFVGTNNTDCTAQEVFDGICEIIKVIKLKLGDVIIVLPTLLPRGQYPNLNRDRNSLVNTLLIDQFQHNPASIKNVRSRNEYANVHVVPIHEDIIQSDLTISHHIMHDYLHLTNQGYYKIFAPVYEKLQHLLQNHNTA